MKRTSWLVVLLAVVALGMAPVMAGAQTPGIDAAGCNVFNTDGLTLFRIDRSHTVITDSSNDNINISCHGDLPDVALAPPKAEVFQGRDYQILGIPVQCSIVVNDQLFCTSNWHEVITPSGNVTLTCHFKGNEACATPPAPE
jgi:hypothetical protein